MSNNSSRFWMIVCLFFISGFTGLIYESIWSQYLKLFLGHAAYAQALVLTIFMGGMAIGSWYVGKNSESKKNLLMLYALAEGIIGFLGLIFHTIFQIVLDFSYTSVLPVLSPEFVQLYKWGIGALLILPQSFLLGTTFPLMSGGLLRRSQRDTGETISLLYFSNSIGAALGVLVSGFLLVKLVGLPGTILSAAIINILLAIFVYGLSKFGTETISRQTNIQNKINVAPRLILLASFFTGTASFIYEIIWIRMLSMVLGSSTHSFELMLSAFITGLALGGFWIRKRIDKISDPIIFAGKIQIIMGVLAILTIPLYNYTYDIMGTAMSGIGRTEVGYTFFSLTSHIICLLIMLPATICAGMTFPLFTTILLKNNYGEKSIGYIYGANTIGSIIGVFFAIFIALPMLGMKFGILVGGIIDIIIGTILILSIIKIGNNTYSFKKLATITSAIIFIILFFTEVDQKHLVSGVYRTGNKISKAPIDIQYYKDGTTASISVTKINKDHLVIATNGKPDAGVDMSPDHSNTGPDEITMVMAAAIPLAAKNDVKQVANIGMGSGLTTHVLLHDKQIETVDTIEIEEAMVEGARNFLPRVSNAYNDQRSNIHIEDAKTFFSINQKKYDLIVSEPSNPWVSGTASLFTKEFYKNIKNYLSDDGIFLQWIQIYELEKDLLFSVLTALQKEFPYYDIFTTDSTNILIVARTDSENLILNEEIFKNEALRKELTLVNINSLQDFYVRYLGNQHIFQQYILKNNNSPNSDYFPILDLNAEKSRFMVKNSIDLTQYRVMPFPFLNFISHQLDHNLTSDVTLDKFNSLTQPFVTAQNIYKKITKDEPLNNNKILEGEIFLLKNKSIDCNESDYEKLWSNALFKIMNNTIQYLQPKEINHILESIQNSCVNSFSTTQKQWLDLYSAIASRDIQKIESYSSIMIKQEDIDVTRKQFLFFSNIISNIFLNKHEGAMEIWEENLNSLFGGGELAFELTLLYSMINQ